MLPRLPAQHRRRRSKSLLIGLSAAGVQLGVGELSATLLPGARSPLAAMGRALIDLTPGPVVDMTVGLLEEKDKPLLMGNLLAGHLGVGAAAGRLWEARRRAALGLLAGHGLLGGLAAASRPDSDALTSLGAGALGAGAGHVTLRGLARNPRPFPIAAALAVGALAGDLARRRAKATTAKLEHRRRAVGLPPAVGPLPARPPEAGFAIEGLSPLYTPNVDFYETDVTFPAPALDSQAWRLRIDGLVEAPLEITYGELLDMGLVEMDATLVCVHNPVGGHRIGTARWTGVPVTELLERVGVHPRADQLLAHSVDGFTAGVPLEIAREHRRGMVAVGMNGEPLPFGHGYPARLLVPGLYGYDANTKWLSRIELTTFALVRDYWTKRGWPRTPAHVRAGSRIDTPPDGVTISAGPTVVAGVAWVPPHGVTGVEVSIDGLRWHAAELAREVNTSTWRRWRYDWSADPGPHEIRVRTHGQDDMQSGHHEPPFPYGTGGCHTISVEAVHADPLPVKDLRARGEGLVAETSRRVSLASSGVASWRRHGFPRPRFEEANAPPRPAKHAGG